MTLSLARSILLAGFAVTAALAATEAEAYSRLTFFGSSSPQYSHQTSSRLRIEGKDGAGALVGIRYCLLNSNCFSTVPGAVNNVVVLEHDPNREEVIAEKCRGVVSTVPQLSCANGDLEISMRVRTAGLIVKFIGDTLLDTGSGSADLVRYEFVGDATKYWSHGDARYDSALKAIRFPAGAYKVLASDLRHHCKPSQVDPGFLLDLPAGTTKTIEIRYRATECTVLIAADVDTSALTMTSDRGALACEARTQRGVPATKSVCTGVFPFNQTVTVSATVPAGREPYFAQIFNECERTGDLTRCRFKPTLDSSLDLFTNIRMGTQAAGSAPPPMPVGLAFANGASNTSDGNAAKGEAAVPMLQLEASAQNGTAMVQAIIVKASGTGRDDLDLVALKVVADANGNGVFDAGETVLAQGRPAADNGELRLGFGSPIAVSGPTRLLVVADFGSDVHAASAAAVLGGSTLLLAFGLFAMPAAGRRRLVPFVMSAVMALALLQACGGGDAEPEPVQVADPVVPPVVVPPVPPAPPVLLTYRLDLIGVEATDTATPPMPLSVRALPVAGATITVEQ